MYLPSAGTKVHDWTVERARGGKDTIAKDLRGLNGAIPVLEHLDTYVVQLHQRREFLTAHDVSVCLRRPVFDARVTAT
jgi:hypothetical protein